MVARLQIQYQSCSGILDWLELGDQVAGQTSEDTVAVVESTVWS